MSMLRSLATLAGSVLLAGSLAACRPTADLTRSSAPTTAARSAISAASDAKNPQSAIDLRRVRVTVTQHRVTVVTRFYGKPSFDCGYVDYSLGVLNDVRVTEAGRTPRLRATSYRGAVGQPQTVTGHPTVVRLSGSLIKFVVPRADVSDFKRYGAWTVLSTYTGCGLAGSYDSIPERGRVKPAHNSPTSRH
jgi:hypothetical protein